MIESRFDRGSWLTLAAVLVMLIVPLVTTLVSFTLPSDGWYEWQAPDRAGFVITTDTTGAASPLRQGDVVLAINGMPIRDGRFPDLRGQLKPGAVLTYTIRRGEQLMDVAVPLVERSPLSILYYNLAVTRDNLALGVIPPLALLLTAYVFIRRPRDPAARLMLVMFTYFFAELWLTFPALNMFLLSYPLPLAYLIYFYDSGWPWLFAGPLLLLALAFPVRKSPLRRFPRLLPFLVFAVPALVLAVGTWFYVTTFDARWHNVFTATLLITYLAAVAALILTLLHNFRTVHDPIGRAQLRWIALGIGVGLGGLLFLYTVTGLAQVAGISGVLIDASLVLQSVLIFVFPLAIGIAILRYRLFDIDLIIRRTITYGILSGTLLLVFFGSVLILHQVFATITGSSQNELVTVLSTLAIAGLSMPLRKRIQDTIDRRFNRSKFDAQKVLERFAATARDETDVNKLSARLVEVLDETMQPASASLWLKTTRETGRRGGDR